MSSALTITENQKLNALENTIARGLKYYIEVGEALLTIREERLYRAQFNTFEDYCLTRWNMSKTHANRMIDASEVAENLTPIGVIPANEAQTRELAALPADEQRTAWQTALDTAPDGKVTAAHVREVVETLSQGKQKPKTNRAGDKYIPQGFDACQTPPEALTPLLPHLYTDWQIWECASGEGLLVEELNARGFQVIASDILTDQNFFEYVPSQWDCIVTNPPYSIKYDWIAQCYAFGKPFALLLPVETLGAKTAQEFFRDCGLEVIFLDRRINFKMPNKGWEGSAAQFPVAWFTYGLNIGQQMTFARLDEEHH